MKKRLLTFVVAFMCLGMVSCGTQYEDTNGPDDFTLQTITDENIINLETGSSGLSYKEQNAAGFHSSKYYAKNHNGVDQIFLTDFIGPSDVEVYIGHMAVESGNFKLVVINNDEIIKEIPVDAFNESFYFENLTGTFAIHVAGESAKFDFHIDIS